MSTRLLFAGIGRQPLTSAVVALLALLAASAPALRRGRVRRSDPGPAGNHRRAGKSSHGQNVQFAGAPTDPIGAEVRLPFRDGQSITLVRKASLAQKDGSVLWRGEVQETGERAVLMLWNSSLLTGYFAYRGTIYTVEKSGRRGPRVRGNGTPQAAG